MTPNIHLLTFAFRNHTPVVAVSSLIKSGTHSRSAQTMSSLVSLPIDILILVLEALGIQDLTILSQTCRSMHTLVGRLPRATGQLLKQFTRSPNTAGQAMCA